MSIFRRHKTPKYWETPGGDYSILAHKVLEAEHTLIAGTTGCGKTSFLRSVMRSLLVGTTPDEAKLIIIDPKRFELTEYRKLPHVIRYAQSPGDALEALKEANRILEARAEHLSRTGQKACKLADVYVIIDELNDLLISRYARAIEAELEHIITLGRALRIHAICCTQNPNRKTIKANIVSCYTCRIGMKCLSPIESRQIVGITGCETLPKHGEVIAILEGEIGHYKAPDYIAENGNDEIIRFWEAQAA